MPNIPYISCHHLLYYYPQQFCNFHMQVFQIKLKYHCPKPIKLQKFLMQKHKKGKNSTQVITGYRLENFSDHKLSKPLSSDRSDNNHRDRTFYISVIVVAAIAATAGKWFPYDHYGHSDRSDHMETRLKGAVSRLLRMLEFDRCK